MKGDVTRLVFVLLVSLGGPMSAAAEDRDIAPLKNLHVSGYFQAIPLHITLDLPEPVGKQRITEYRLQNRLNLRMDFTPDFTFHWQMRSRLIAGNWVTNDAFYTDAMTRDSGLFNLSWTIAEGEDWILHSVPDRLYGDWSKEDWSVRVGRQRVNWGVNIITNPNDIFNPYSVYEFDYPERPGSDTLRIQHFIGFGSRVELAVKPASEIKESVAAILYAFRLGSYDLQAIGGYYRDRVATGAGWAGTIGSAGFKGETMHYADIEAANGNRETNYILAASVDYVFPGSLFLVAEYLYNQEGGKDDLEYLAGRLLSDNPSYSRHQAALRASYRLTPRLRTSFTLIGFPDRDSAFVSPALTWSVIENLDLRVLGQFLLVDERRVSEEPVNLIAGFLSCYF